MRVDRVVLRDVQMRLVKPFRTGFGEERMRRVIIVEVHAAGQVGYGETPVLSGPYYNEETFETAWHILASFLIPTIFQVEFQSPAQLAAQLQPIRRNYMAKAGLEGAVWDLFARLHNTSLARMLGGQKTRIPVGISLGIAEDLDDLVRAVGKAIETGYRRVKIKIKPAWDIEPLAALRRTFGDIPLMVDANSAYTLDDIERLRRLDRFGLMMIEQPLAYDDIVDHARLQKGMDTPICLDESIHSTADARKALDLGSCRVINIKPARVGGLTEARRIHDLCREREIPVWCGGMLETGIGRAHNIALASLDGFSLPADISASRRYWHQDLVSPEVTVIEGGYVAVPQGTGLGLHVRHDHLEAWTRSSDVFDNPQG